MIPVLGIDPGVRGGMAVVSSNGICTHVRAFSPDMTEGQLVSCVSDAVMALLRSGSRLCYMEKVGQLRGDGAQGAFTFGKVVGLIRGGLHAHNITVVDVYPIHWMAAMNCLTAGNKNISKMKAIELFPQIDVTHAIADALLIALYGARRQLK